MRRGVVPLALAAVLLAPPAGAQTVRPGRYEAQLCVATQPDAAATCGPAELDVASASRLSVRVADIVYRLALHGAQLDVATMHGRMQIDEFSAAYDWKGDTLRFGDPAKDVRYEVRVGARKRAAGT